jgi:hypothetical protein
MRGSAVLYCLQDRNITLFGIGGQGVMVGYNHLEEGFHPHPRNCHHGQQRNTMHAPYIYEVAERSPQQQFKDNTTMGHNLTRVIYKVSSCYLHHK